MNVWEPAGKYWPGFCCARCCRCREVVLPPEGFTEPQIPGELAWLLALPMLDEDGFHRRGLK